MSGVMRIGDLAERARTTPRTIRYYEEIGLLPSAERAKGRHRVYDEADLERLEEITRLRDLLGLRLEDVKRLLEAEDARAALRRRWHATEDTGERAQIVDEALSHVDAQLALVRRRRDELDALESELVDKRRRLRARRRELA